MIKNLAIMIAAVCTVGLLTSESQAQHYHGHRGGFNQPVRTSGFSISVGNGFNGVNYSNFRGGGFNNYGYRGGYGGGHFGTPIYRPSYGHGGYGRPVYGGGGISIGYGSGYRGGYGGGYRGGYGRSCGW